MKSIIKQFVIHHDNCYSAEMCWDVLQNERGLSCHFLVDNDGTIYQTLDLALMGYDASEWNTNSIGVELCNIGSATQYADADSNGKNGGARDRKACKINGHTYLAYDYTPAQYDQMKKPRKTSPRKRFWPRSAPSEMDACGHPRVSPRLSSARRETS